MSKKNRKCQARGKWGWCGVGLRGARAVRKGEKRANGERVIDERVHNGRGNDGLGRIKPNRSTAGVVGRQRRRLVRIDGAQRSDSSGCADMSCHLCLGMHQ
jgi:hypothetical protein